MRRPSARHSPLRPALAGLLLACACRGPAPAPRRTAAPDPAPPPAAVGIDRLEGYFPNVPLQTQDGATVWFYDDLVRDKLVLVQFLYTRCEGLCPGVTSSLVDVQTALGERLGRDVFLLSLTLDPENDGPAELTAYRSAIGARAGWTFLTGKLADIDAIRRRLGVYDPDPEIDADKSQHSGKVVIGNERLGRWASIPGEVGAKRILRMFERIEGPAMVVADAALADR